MLLIRVYHISCSSTVTPRRLCFETCSVGVVSKFRFQGSCCFWCFCLVAINMHFISVEFSASQFLQHHPEISFKLCCKSLRTRQKLCFISVNTLQLDATTVPLSDSVKSVGILLDSTLSMKNFISQTAKSCYYQVCRFSSVWEYLSTEATMKLVTSLILSRLDYCSPLLSGLPVSSAFVAYRTVLLASY